MTTIAWEGGGPVFKNGGVGSGQPCCCKKCSGPCQLDSNCGEGCRCLGSVCVNECSGPCDTEEDCPVGCDCVDGQCVSPCCVSSIDCEIRVTVTYSNGQTRISGEDQLDEGGNSIEGSPISASISDCNTVSFSHYGLNTGTCTQYARKNQKIDCSVCCPGGEGCNCSFGPVVSESYSFLANDPGADCEQEFEINHVTAISFSLVECGCCACCPLLSASESGQTVSMTSDCSCKTGSLSGSSPVTMSIGGGFASGSATIATDCEYEIDGITYFSNAYISIGCCDCEEFGKKIAVSVSGYIWDDGAGLGYSSMSAYECTDDVSVGEDGKITGSVTPASVFGCGSVTLTFG